MLPTTTGPTTVHDNAVTYLASGKRNLGGEARPRARITSKVESPATRRRKRRRWCCKREEEAVETVKETVVGEGRKVVRWGGEDSILGEGLGGITYSGDLEAN